MMGKATLAANLTPYQTTIRRLSDRLVEAQRPIRILDAIKWDDPIEKAFFAAGCRQLPPVTRAYYTRRPLPFDPETKRQELLGIEGDVHRQLGDDHAAGRILTRMCQEYREVVDLLVHRGTPRFNVISENLYGSAADSFRSGETSLADLGRLMAGLLDQLAHENHAGLDDETLDAPQAVALLARRLTGYFDNGAAVRVQLSDGIVADAAAGCDYIKIRHDARFTPREVRLLEVHEGWVHLGTTLNGSSQPICTFLGKGPPSSVLTQEGLAVLTELFAAASHPNRVRRLTNRVAAVALAEQGANFLDVFRFFLQENNTPKESYQQTMRVFRGSLPEGCGPFTKDLCYSKGFVLIYNFIRSAVSRGVPERVSLLFCGKTNLADLQTLTQLVEEGLVAPPRYVPPHFADLNALTTWLRSANGLRELSAEGCRTHSSRSQGS
jgi:uncharacterized protein (TIGR02421 family)